MTAISIHAGHNPAGKNELKKKISRDCYNSVWVSRNKSIVRSSFWYEILRRMSPK